MASAKKIAEIIAAIKTIYPYYSKDADSGTLAKTWAVLLRDISDEVTDIALMQSLKVCKVPPTPADVLEQVRSIQAAFEPTDEEMWTELLQALRRTRQLVYRFGFTFVEDNGKTQGEIAKEDFEALWNSLPEKLRYYLGSKGELIRMGNYSDEDMTYEKTRFLKTMPTIAKRQEYMEIANLLPDNTNNKLLTKG